MKKYALALLCSLVAGPLYADAGQPSTGQRIQQLTKSLQPGEKTVIILLIDALLHESLSPEQEKVKDQLLKENNKDAMREALRMIIPTLQLNDPSIAAGIQSLMLQLAPGTVILGMTSLPMPFATKLSSRLEELGIHLNVTNTEQLGKTVPAIRNICRNGIVYITAPEAQKALMQLGSQKQYRVIFFPDLAELVGQALE